MSVTKVVVIVGVGLSGVQSSSDECPLDSEWSVGDDATVTSRMSAYTGCLKLACINQDGGNAFGPNGPPCSQFATGPSDPTCQMPFRYGATFKDLCPALCGNCDMTTTTTTQDRCSAACPLDSQWSVGDDATVTSRVSAFSDCLKQNCCNQDGSYLFGPGGPPCHQFPASYCSQPFKYGVTMADVCPAYCGTDVCNAPATPEPTTPAPTTTTTTTTTPAPTTTTPTTTPAPTTTTPAPTTTTTTQTAESAEMKLKVIGGWRYWTKKDTYLSASRYWRYADKRDADSTYLAFSTKEEVYLKRELRSGGFALKTTGGSNSYQVSDAYVTTGTKTVNQKHDDRDVHSWYFWVSPDSDGATVFTQEEAVIDGTSGFKLKLSMDDKSYYMVAGVYYHTDHRGRYSTFSFCNDTMGEEAGTLFAWEPTAGLELDAMLGTRRAPTGAVVGAIACAMTLLVAMVKVLRRRRADAMDEPLLEA